MTTSALAKTGVEAVIEGLKEFTGGFNKMNSLVSGFGKTAKESSGILGVFGNIVDTVGESLRRIGEFVIAGIILEGIKRITAAIGDMIASVVDAAVEFQGLQIQLETLLAGDILESGQVDNFTDALALAVPQAEELFFWIQKTSLQTPFDIADVTRVITMAEAYGFTADEAKGLTGTILDFSAGMNLTDEQMRRIIENFGQMIQQGKVTNTELRDLARGAMVPISPILERMQQNLGLTTKEFEKLRKEGKLEVMPFIQAFTDIVGEEMPGAASRANRTISAVIGNMKDLVQGVLSFNVVKPVLDVVSDKLATILDTLTSGERGEKLLSITSQLGEELAEIAKVIFGGVPGGETIADTILGILGKVRFAVAEIRTLLQSEGTTGEKAWGIVEIIFGTDWKDRLFGVYRTVSGVITNIVNFITGREIEEDTPIGKFFGSIQRAIENFKTFWEENKEGILGAFSSIMESALGTGEITGESILEIIGGAIEGLSQKMADNGPTIVETLDKIAAFIKETFLPAWEKITAWIEENWPNILKFFIGLKIGWEILKAVAIVVGIVTAALLLLSSPIGILIALFPIITGFIVLFWDKIKIAGVAISQLWVIIKDFAEKAGNKIAEWATTAASAVAGWVHGFINGIVNAWNTIAPWIRWFVDQIKNLLGIHSPSTIFAEIGRQLNEGLAEGIAESIQLPAKAMDLAVSHVISAGVSGVQGGITNNSAVTNNFNMTVNSSARTEPIVADFNAMQAMIGAR